MTKVRSIARKGRAFHRVKHGSAVVPIYCGTVQSRTRYTVAFWLNGSRIRRTFGSFEKARQEAQIIAKRIHEGMAATNDLDPLQRSAYLAAERLVAPYNIPTFSAVEEYVACRQLLGQVSLMAVVQDFIHRTKGVSLGAKVPDLINEFLAAKAQDSLSKTYLGQFATAVGRFARVFPGEIMNIKSGDIDRWLRGLAKSPVTRNSVHRCIKVFFSFAKARGYLLASEATAAEVLSLAREGDTVTEIFRPSEIRAIMQVCPADLLGFVAIGAFAGLRVAEICRLDWSAVDLERRIIMLRADQAKTASRRIIPIADNLAAWLRHLHREGPVAVECKTSVQVTALAKKLGIKWPHNVLRHSFISYRIAEIKDAARVALEAGNSPEIIFKHYRELVTENEAREWFSIQPPEGWSPVPAKACCRRRRQP